MKLLLLFIVVLKLTLLHHIALQRDRHVDEASGRAEQMTGKSRYAERAAEARRRDLQYCFRVAPTWEPVVWLTV